MSIPDLEQRLNRLADQVSAPATDTTRQAVRRQAKALHRRRRTRQAAASGLLATLVVGAAVWLRGAGGPADIETIAPVEEYEPPAGEPGELPTFSVDALDLAPVHALEGITDLEGDYWNSFQVFRQPTDIAGPTVLLWLIESGDPVIPESNEPGQRAVDVNGHAGSLSTSDPIIGTLIWELDNEQAPPSVVTDPFGKIISWGLSDDELLAFAEGLVSRRRDGEGFAAAVLPGGIQEVELAGVVPPSRTTDARFLELEAPDGTRVALEVLEVGQAYLESQRFCTAADTPEYLLSEQSRVIEEVEVLGEPGVLAEMGGAEPGWCVTWRPTSTTVAQLRITRRTATNETPGSAGASFVEVDQDDAMEILDGLHEIDENQWQDLLADFPPASDGMTGTDEEQPSGAG